MVDFKGFHRVSLLDYPGKIAAIAFVGGCNFRCGFCYNRDLVLNPQELPSISEGEILSYLEANRSWLDGLVVTGGEPTLHPDLPIFLEKAKKLGYSVKLDTNGSNPKILAELIERRLVDYVALDVKAPLIDERYRAVIGEQANGVFEEVKKSVELLKNSGVDYEFRTTVIPETLKRDDLSLIAEQIKGSKRYYLQQFKSDALHVDGRYSNVAPYPLEFIKEIREEIAPNFQVCMVRGARSA